MKSMKENFGGSLNDIPKSYRKVINKVLGLEINVTNYCYFLTAALTRAPGATAQAER